MRRSVLMNWKGIGIFLLIALAAAAVNLHT
jgi:hypothetical protein